MLLLAPMKVYVALVTVSTDYQIQLDIRQTLLCSK